MENLLLYLLSCVCMYVYVCMCMYVCMYVCICNDTFMSSSEKEPLAAPLFAQLRVDGGMSSNSLFLQFQSDLLNVPLILPTDTETTALGAGARQSVMYFTFKFTFTLPYGTISLD